MDLETLFKICPDSIVSEFKYHLANTGKLPSLIQISDYNSDRWKAFLKYSKEKYEYILENKIKLKYLNADNSISERILLHFSKGITLWNPNPNTASFLYDSATDEEILNDLKPKFVNIKSEETNNSIGLIRDNGRGYLEVKTFDYTLPEHSLIPHYSEPLQKFYSSMKKDLKNSIGGGLYLFYGEPGTGKTSFIKRVLSKTAKKALFITPEFTQNLTSPKLISLLMDYPDSILVIEDAESVIMERQADNSSAVSNLLNLTDGFLADFLNLKIICTFNTELGNIDKALLRDGRLKGMHEFTKMSPQRAAEIAEVLGTNIDPQNPMTLAEICNSDKSGNKFKPKKIGFNGQNNGKPV